MNNIKSFNNHKIMNKIDSFKNDEQSVPYVVRDGVFGATIYKDKEPIYLRMEVLTEKNTKDWSRFREMSCWVANANSRGVLSGLVKAAGTDRHPDYEAIKEVTGFTEEEYAAFTKKAIDLKAKTENKIVTLLEHNSVGANHMPIYFALGSLLYIVYASRNPDFSIQNASAKMPNEKISFKKFIEAYDDVLITVGSNFSNKDFFHNRGISRNPYWVFEEKYSGLSMILHGFTGAVAAQYFPEKKEMRVMPVGSMQYLIKKSLLPGEGHVIKGNDQKIDLTALDVSTSNPEGALNYIKVSALTRIYNQAINS
jgi:hypothetical protein